MKWNGVPAIHGAEERSADGRVGVGIPTPHHRIHDTRLKAGCMEQLPQGIVERTQHPTLMIEIDRLRQGGLRSPIEDDPLQGLWLRSILEGIGYRHGIERIGL